MAAKHPKIDLRLGPDTNISALYHIVSQLLCVLAKKDGQLLSAETDPMTVTLTIELPQPTELPHGNN